MNSPNRKPRISPRPLTRKERRVLEFIESFMQKQELSPSYQEIQEHFGFRSINSVQSYLRQLQKKGYIHNPGNNQKRAISILQSAQTVLSSLGLNNRRPLPGGRSSSPHSSPFAPFNSEAPSAHNIGTQTTSFSVPLLGRVAAGRPIEAIDEHEFIEVPSSLVRHPDKTFALKVEGQSMIEDGIMDGDFIFVQQQAQANNGEIVVAIVNNEATVKRFYLHASPTQPVIHSFPQTSSQSSSFSVHQVELRPANTNMDSMWFSPEQVEIRGVVVGLLRNYL